MYLWVVCCNLIFPITLSLGGGTSSVAHVEAAKKCAASDWRLGFNGTVFPALTIHNSTIIIIAPQKFNSTHSEYGLPMFSGEESKGDDMCQCLNAKQNKHPHN